MDACLEMGTRATNVPTIAGVDIKTPGPFKVEDVTSLPAEMFKFLLDEGLADKLEINKASRRGAYSKTSSLRKLGASA